MLKVRAAAKEIQPLIAFATCAGAFCVRDEVGQGAVGVGAAVIDFMAIAFHFGIMYFTQSFF